MDKKDLTNILGDVQALPPDASARKRALDLAREEFASQQKKNEKKSQGSSLFGRLMGSSNDNDRRYPMDRKLVYGGMATAMAVILIAGISVDQLRQQMAEYDRAQPSSLLARAGAEKKESPGAGEVTSAYKEQIDAFLKENAEMEAGQVANVSPVPVARQDAARNAPLADAKVKTAVEKAEADMAAPASQPPMGAIQQNMAARSMSAEGMVAAPGILMMAPVDADAQPYYQDEGRDNFKQFDVNPVRTVAGDPVSTFSIDVDTASYSFVRKTINNGALPLSDAVRVEEMVNYFDYDWPLPETKEQPFKPTVAVLPSPWKDGNRLIEIGIKGYDLPADTHPRSNLVFLLDVSGSMNEPDKLPLVKSSMKMLLDTLRPDDTVAIAVYAGAAGTVLEPTPVQEKNKIIAAIDNLQAGGSTAGAQGIALAYQLAEQHFDRDAVNRVILATDGDFNVGMSDPEQLKHYIETKRQTGVFLSVLGFGQGNLNDTLMQELAQNGNGVAAYIDTLNEARKVLVEEATSTLFPIAKDVKIQVEFNPATVAEYRLVGYETRALKREDFNNDKVDAGDIGAGHAVTAIYEITPVGGPRTVDESRYARAETHKADATFGDEYAFLKIRYKLPDQDVSKLITTPVTKTEDLTMDRASADQKFAVAVASFGQLLKGGQYTGAFSYDDVIKLAQDGKGTDEFGYRAEFVNLVRLAKTLRPAEPVIQPVPAPEPVPVPLPYHE